MDNIRVDMIRPHHRARAGSVGGDAPDAAAMTFAEIAARLGSTEAKVQKVYSKAIRKLRERPVLMRRLRSVAADLAAARAQRMGPYGERD
jgi:predicted transcriptional regulator